MTDRARIRRGRTVSYTPTSTEVTASGAGPWMGVITDVNADGTVDLLLDTPNPAAVAEAALADPLHTETAIAAFTDPPTAGETALLRTFVNSLQADLNLAVTLINELRGVSVNSRKLSVEQGSQPGQFSLLQTGPQAL